MTDRTATESEVRAERSSGFWSGTDRAIEWMLEAIRSGLHHNDAASYATQMAAAHARFILDDVRNSNDRQAARDEIRARFNVKA